MHVLVLAAFLVTFAMTDQSMLERAMRPGWPTAAAGACYLLGAVLLARLGRRLILGVLDARSRQGRPPRAWNLRWAGLVTVLGRCWLIAGLGGVLGGGYARLVMQDLGLGSVPLVGTLAAILPFVAALLVTWVIEYPCHRRTRRLIALQNGPDAPPVMWTRRQYLAYKIRHQLLFIVAPVSMIVLIGDSLMLYVLPLLPENTAGELVVLGAMAAAVVGVFLIAPLIVVRIWGSRPLPDGPVRRSLQQLARRMGFGFRDIHMWRSGGVVANAGVMGLCGPVRYLLISDALLDNMDDQSITSVLAHEAGHVVSHHLPYMAAFAISAAVLCTAVGELLMAVGADWTGPVAWAMLMIASWGLAFGWISRRFERQSDVIAAWSEDFSADGRISPESAAVFARALEQVARLNGIARSQRNWRHGSIAGRIDYLRRLAAEGGTRRRIDRVVRRIKTGLLCALVLAIIVVGFEVVREIVAWNGQ